MVSIRRSPSKRSGSASPTLPAEPVDGAAPETAEEVASDLGAAEVTGGLPEGASEDPAPGDLGQAAELVQFPTAVPEPAPVPAPAPAPVPVTQIRREIPRDPVSGLHVLGVFVPQGMSRPRAALPVLVRFRGGSGVAVVSDPGMLGEVLFSLLRRDLELEGPFEEVRIQSLNAQQRVSVGHAIMRSSDSRLDRSSALSALGLTAKQLA